MKRREFLTAGTAGLVALAATTPLNAQEPPNRLFQRRSASRAPVFTEVRKYTVKDADKRAKLVEILDNALIPALNRQGVKPVGVLVPTEEGNEAKYANNIFVAAQHNTVDSFVNVNTKLLADSRYMKDAAPIFETTSKDPVYTDCETFLLKNFPTVPQIEVPNLGPDRVFQWRLYRSFNIERNAAKVKMFDKGGEIPLFREVNMHPIFFGDVIAGTRMPALLYMIGFASQEKRDAAWREFGSHPKWQEMRVDPQYADTATEIDNVVLVPSPGSKI